MSTIAMRTDGRGSPWTTTEELERFLDGASRPAPPLSVAELAEALGLTRSKTYRLLERGLIPGAFKTDPTLPKSHYFIPADAPARFRARGERAS